MTAAPYLWILCSMLNMRSRRLLTIIVAASIVILSLIPKPPEIPGGVHFADKIAHFIAYAALSFLVAISFFNGKGRAGKDGSGNTCASKGDSGQGNGNRGSRVAETRRCGRMRRFTTVMIVAALCILFGGLIEYLQTFTGRQPELWDMAADLAGAVCGAVVGSGISRRVSPGQEKQG